MAILSASRLTLVDSSSFFLAVQNIRRGKKHSSVILCMCDYMYDSTVWLGVRLCLCV